MTRRVLVKAAGGGGDNALMEFSGGGTHINKRIVKKRMTQRTSSSHEIEVVQVEEVARDSISPDHPVRASKAKRGVREEVNKGKRGMPGQRVPKKDVVHCEKRR